MVTYSKIAIANDTIKTTDIKGKEYAEVNQRIKAFRMVYPTGNIETKIVSLQNGICIIQANVYDERGKHLGTGTAYEKENSTFINKTSYIENCETSAIGRALGMAGFGIDVSIASAEEVENAINNQENIKVTKEDAEKYKIAFGKYKGKMLKDVPKNYLEWLGNSTNDEYLKKCIETLLNKKMLTDEENDERCWLLASIQTLEMEMNYNHESALKHYNAESDKSMTIEQLKDYEAILKGLKKERKNDKDNEVEN